MEYQDILNNLSIYLNREYPKKYKSKLDFAAACEVDEKTIRRILDAKQNLSIKVLISISKAIGIRLSELIEIIDKEQ